MLSLTAVTAAAQCEVGQLFAPLASAGDSFGQSLDFDGDELVVGSRYSATVFVRQDPGTPLDDTDDVWVVQANLLGEEMDNGFGSAVALDGDHLLVGAPFFGGFASIGAAYVFVRNDGGTPRDVGDDTWTEQSKFTPPSTATISLFGTSVSLHGDRLAVGDPNGHLATGAPLTGLVLVARRDAGGTPDDPGDDQWITEALLVPGDGGIFGSKVELFGSELLVVGTSAEIVRRIYRFRLDGAGTPRDPTDDTWVENGLILAPPGEEPGFGRDIDRDGDHLLVGGSEVAFEYRLDDAGTPTDPLDDLWVQEGVLTASDDTPLDDAFGSEVSLHGDRALVGARKHGDFGSGAAYLFQRDESATDPIGRWMEVVKLTPPAGTGARNFGDAVLLAGDVAFVGESGFFQFLSAADSPPADSIYGQVRIYAMADAPWTFIDSALPGANGLSPCLIGAGSLAPDSEAALVIEHANAAAVAALVIGAGIADVPFKGGVLVPEPQHVAWVTTSITGGAVLSGRWPQNVPAGFHLYVQVWMPDDSGPAGFVATNAVRADAP